MQMCDVSEDSELACGHEVFVRSLGGGSLQGASRTCERHKGDRLSMRPSNPLASGGAIAEPRGSGALAPGEAAAIASAWLLCGSGFVACIVGVGALLPLSALVGRLWAR